MKEIFTLDLKFTTLVGCTVMKQSGNVVVSGQKGSKDLCTISLFSPQKGAGGWSLKQEKQQWQSPCKHPVCLLGLLILWREYIAISCPTCENIKLMDLNSDLEETVVFSGRKVSRMCKGWHKVYASMLGTTQILELDCSTTSFTLLRTIDIGIKDPRDICYIPSPIKFLVAFSSDPDDGIRGVLCESGENIWFNDGKGGSLVKTDGKGGNTFRCNDGVIVSRITPSALLHLPQYRALLVADTENFKFTYLDPSTGSHVQNTDIRDLGNIVQIFGLMFHNGRILMAHTNPFKNFQLSCFSVEHI